MAQTIVVGIDGSEGANRAFRYARELARSSDATVKPVLAWEYPALSLLPFPVGLPVPPVEAMQADAESRAEVLAAALTDPGDLSVTRVVVRQGSPGRVLCDVAGDDDLLVVGSRGLGSVKGVLLGSVGTHCVGAAPCPVLLVPDQFNETPAGLVVVGVDGSPASTAAVAWADLHLPESHTLMLVHARQLPVSMDPTAIMLDADVIEAAAREMLEKAAANVVRHEATILCTRGDARTELARLASNAEMLVLGACGHGMVQRWVLGSVASHVVHHLVAPTVVVRAN